MKRHVVILSLAFALLVLAGCIQATGSSSNPAACAASAEECRALAISTSYSDWHKLFAEPRNVAMQLALMCRTAFESELKYLDSEHSKFFVQLFVNTQEAVNLMKTEGARTFPEGTTIVKEKWAQTDAMALDKSKKTAAGLGIMIKAGKGFDPEGGDWQYMYMDEAGKVTTDQQQLQHCRACHMAEKARDAVFYPQVIAE